MYDCIPEPIKHTKSAPLLHSSGPDQLPDLLKPKLSNLVHKIVRIGQRKLATRLDSVSKVSSAV